MIKIAIIEDSKALSGVFKKYLARSRFDARFYRSKPESIDQLINDKGFDIIVCPGFPKYQNGPHILQTIKACPDFHQASFVISTSLQKESVGFEWDLRDIRTLLFKPFDQTSLINTLNQALPAEVDKPRNQPVALVIDDSKAVRNRLTEYLNVLQFNVTTASDGMDGLKTASDIRPDLILVDVEMPILDGFEFCRQLSQEPDIKNIPTIVVSGTIDEQQFRKGFRAGAIDFLEKPVSQADLAAIIESVSVRDHSQSDGTTLILSADETLTAILTKSLNFLNSSIHVCATLDELETYLCVAIPDIVILDLSQNTEKLSICRHVRNLVAGDSAVIIAVADETDRDIMFQCFKFGATEFIIKPFGRDEVKARIENHIKLKQLQDELVKKNRILESLAYKDKLTGMMNRRFFDNAIREELEKAKTNQSSLCFLMLDLDNFKSVNDNFGHDIGDMVLNEVAAMIMDNVLENAIPCRYGGEEFCIIFPDTPLDDALKNSEKIKRYCSVKAISQHRIYQTLSGGLACFPHTSSEHKLLIHADACLYQAKKAGKNRIIAQQKNTNSL
jgi:two-component system cell cycle response regulator